MIKLTTEENTSPDILLPLILVICLILLLLALAVIYIPRIIG